MLLSPSDDLRNELERVATLYEALRRVASVGRALRRGDVGTSYIGAAVEGTAGAALSQLLGWAEQIPGSSARKLEARIRTRPRHGARTVLGTYYARGLVAAARRGMEQD